MIRFLQAGTLLLAIMSSGCAMCKCPFDACYAASGGSCCAESHCRGRAGSVFSAASQSRSAEEPPPSPTEW